MFIYMTELVCKMGSVINAHIKNRLLKIAQESRKISRISLIVVQYQKNHFQKLIKLDG